MYTEVGIYVRPITAEHVLKINALFCQEEGFMPNLGISGAIESKLYAAYYYFLNKLEAIQVTSKQIKIMIPEVAGLIAYYIASTQMFPTANKRTAAVASEMFLHENGFCLQYKTEVHSGLNELADMLIGIGEHRFSKEDAIEWYKQHAILDAKYNHDYH